MHSTLITYRNIEKLLKTVISWHLMQHYDLTSWFYIRLNDVWEPYMSVSLSDSGDILTK